MEELIYSLSQEKIKEENYLKVTLSNKGESGKRKLYAADIKKSALDKEVIDLLILAKLRFLKKPMASAIDTLELNDVVLEETGIEKILRALAKTSRVYYQGKKIFIDPLSFYSLEYRVEDLGDALLVEGHLFTASGSFPTEKAEALIFPSYILQGGVLKGIDPRIDPKWIRLVFPEKVKLEGVKAQQFRDLFEDETPPINGPRAFWMGEKKKEIIPDPLPVLVLSDRTGAFAELHMDYGKRGVFPFQERKENSFRKKEAEGYWEKDLIETGFQKKVVEKSHYYCPLPYVAKSLSFLLEMGWQVLDFQNKRVIRQSGLSIEALDKEDKITLRGKVRFQDYEADLKEIVGTFNKRQQFIELSSSEIGLLDEPLLQELEPLQEGEWEEKGIGFKKERIGELASFFERKEVSWESSLEELKKAASLQFTSLEPGPDFQGTLYPYQKEGIHWMQFLYQNHLGGLLADEMGLGKTVQILAFLSLILAHKKQPVLIVTSTSLLGSWKKEIQRFLPSVTFSLFDKESKKRGIDPFLSSKILLTTYPILRLEEKIFSQTLFSVCILDEAQIIKNPASQTAEAAHRLQALFKLALSGTPIENRLEDLWSIFHFLNKELLGDLSSFRAQTELSHVDFRPLRGIKKRLKPFILRREKKEVAKDLPEKVEQEIWIEMTEGQRAYYEEVLKSRRKEVLASIQEGGKNRMGVLEAILRLRQIAAWPGLFYPEEENFAELGGKLPKLLEDIVSVKEGKEKVLVFSQFTTFLKKLKSELDALNITYCYLDGETKDREKEVERFQTDPEVSVFLMSLKAGGVGLNLQMADYVFLVEPWWNEAVERQAIDRAHRLGREKPVIARRYLTMESIEEKIQKIKEKKKALISSAFSLDEEVFSGDDLYELALEAFSIQ